MDMWKALMDGDYEQVIGAHPDIIFFEDAIEYPYLQDGEDVPSYLRSFVNSDLFDVFAEAVINSESLKVLRQSLIDFIDSERDFYSSPIYIFDTNGRAFFIYDRSRQLYFDTDDNESDKESILNILMRAKKDRSETVIIVWNVFQAK